MSNTALFDQEELNGIRVSKLIVDVASDILRDRIVDVIKSKARNFNKQDTQSYTSLDDYLTKKQAVFLVDTFFYPDQLKVMYPDNKPTKSSKEFDMTLCLNLFRRLLHPPWRNATPDNISPGHTSSWSTEPNHNDTSFASHLVRLKIIRDLNYGHIHRSLSLNQKEMERLETFKNANYSNDYSLLAKLEYSIYGLCKNVEQRTEYKTKIDACLEQPISEPKVVNHYKNTIETLVAKDRETNELFTKQIELLNIKDEKILALLKQNHDIDKNNCEQMKTNQQNLFKALGKLDVSYEKLLNKMYHMKDIAESLEKIGSVLQVVNENSKEIVSSISDLEYTIKTGLHANHCMDINIEDFKSYFEEDSQYNIRILVLDIENSDKFEMDKLIKSVALTSWNIIVDLSTGLSEMSTKICQNFKRNYVKTNIVRLNSLSKSDLTCINRKRLKVNRCHSRLSKTSWAHL